MQSVGRLEARRPLDEARLAGGAPLGAGALDLFANALLASIRERLHLVGTLLGDSNLSEGRLPEVRVSDFGPAAKVIGPVGDLTPPIRAC